MEKYSDRSEQEWTPLFYRILNSRINDWYRRNTVRNRHRSWLSKAEGEGEGEDPTQTAPDPYGRSPDEQAVTNEGMDKLQIALEGLPARQQQAFLLRAWEGLDVRQTATAMNKLDEGILVQEICRHLDASIAHLPQVIEQSLLECRQAALLQNSHLVPQDTEGLGQAVSRELDDNSTLSPDIEARLDQIRHSAVARFEKLQEKTTETSRFSLSA